MEAATGDAFAEFAGKQLCWSQFLIKFHAFRSATLLKKTPAQVFSREFHEIFHYTFFTEHLRATASIYSEDSQRCSITTTINALLQRTDNKFLTNGC